MRRPNSLSSSTPFAKNTCLEQRAASVVRTENRPHAFVVPRLPYTLSPATKPEAYGCKWGFSNDVSLLKPHTLRDLLKIGLKRDSGIWPRLFVRARVC